MIPGATLAPATRSECRRTAGNDDERALTVVTSRPFLGSHRVPVFAGVDVLHTRCAVRTPRCTSNSPGGCQRGSLNSHPRPECECRRLGHPECPSTTTSGIASKEIADLTAGDHHPSRNQSSSGGASSPFRVSNSARIRMSSYSKVESAHSSQPRSLTPTSRAMCRTRSADRRRDR